MKTQSHTYFRDRHDAGRFLAQKLKFFAHAPDVVVLALPRGGVPVAFELAREIAAPLDLLIVRKLGVPGQEELALGAIAPGGVRVLNEDLVKDLGISSQLMETMVALEKKELARRNIVYRKNRTPVACRGNVAILVDDGLATGASMRAAIRAVRTRKPARLVVAVPVGSLEACRQIQKEADELICGRCPDPLESVGACYEDFSQVTDEEVQELMKQMLSVSGSPS